MVTYWLELRTGCIYKYEFGTKPYTSKTASRPVAYCDYSKAPQVAARRSLTLK